MRKSRKNRSIVSHKIYMVFDVCTVRWRMFILN